VTGLAPASVGAALSRGPVGIHSDRFPVTGLSHSPDRIAGNPQGLPPRPRSRHHQEFPMKPISAAVLALFAAAPAFASSPFTVDFEAPWTYGTDVAGYYAGGTASDGSSGANLGVSFVGVAGLSNDSNFSYYSGAPSPVGTAYAYTDSNTPKALLNVAGGVSGYLAFYYSSPSAVSGALKAYSGLNGTGTLLGSVDLAANSGNYSTWTKQDFSFKGTALSFDLSGSANAVGLDNISSVPEPTTVALLLAGIGAVALSAYRRRER
jgi:hypothetical protein